MANHHLETLMIGVPTFAHIILFATEAGDGFRIRQLGLRQER